MSDPEKLQALLQPQDVVNLWYVFREDGQTLEWLNSTNTLAHVVTANLTIEDDEQAGL